MLQPHENFVCHSFFKEAIVVLPRVSVNNTDEVYAYTKDHVELKINVCYDLLV